MRHSARETVIVGEIDAEGRHVFSDGTPVVRPSREDMAYLDRQWFGPPEVGSESFLNQHGRKPPCGRVTLVCHVCGESFTERAAEVESRLKKSVTKQLVCSRACDHERKRRAQQTTEAA